MDSTKLLIFPLLFLIVFTFLGAIGLSSETWDSTHDFSYGADAGWYDADGTLVAYENYTYAVADGGHIAYVGGVPYWQNSTGSFLIYPNDSASTTQSNGFTYEVDLSTTIGLIAVVSGGILLAGFIGTRILGSTIGGGNDESASAIWKGTVLLVVWSIFSITGLNMITGVPLFGPFFYMFLTIIYCLGVINQVGHPGED